MKGPEEKEDICLCLMDGLNSITNYCLECTNCLDPTTQLYILMYREIEMVTFDFQVYQIRQTFGPGIEQSNEPSLLQFSKDG